MTKRASSDNFDAVGTIFDGNGSLKRIIYVHQKRGFDVVAA